MSSLPRIAIAEISAAVKNKVIMGFLVFLLSVIKNMMYKYHYLIRNYLSYEVRAKSIQAF